MNTNNDTIKQQLHQMIDAIDDVQVLNALREEAATYMLQKDVAEEDDDRDPVDYLTPEQLQDLEESIEEVERGEVITHEEFLPSMNTWLTDLHIQDDLKTR
jgi:dsDNA-specific endonuclease/ATPase MutS2